MDVNVCSKISVCSPNYVATYLFESASTVARSFALPNQFASDEVALRRSLCSRSVLQPRVRAVRSRIHSYRSCEAITTIRLSQALLYSFRKVCNSLSCLYSSAKPLLISCVADIVNFVQNAQNSTSFHCSQPGISLRGQRPMSSSLPSVVYIPEVGCFYFTSLRAAT